MHLTEKISPPNTARWRSRWLQYHERRIRQLLEAETNLPVSLPLLPTGTQVDTGLWWRKSRVWLASGTQEWALLASGPEPFIQVISTDAIERCGYNPITGELWLELLTHQPLTSFEVAAIIARQLLATLQKPEKPAYA
jgi:hypothetical protein